MQHVNDTSCSVRTRAVNSWYNEAVKCLLRLVNSAVNTVDDYCGFILVNVCVAALLRAGFRYQNDLLDVQVRELANGRLYLYFVLVICIGVCTVFI